MTLSRFSACTIIVSLLLLIIYTKNIIYLESTHEISWSDHQIYRIYGKNVSVGVPSLQNLKLYNLCSTQDTELKLSPDFTYYNDYCYHQNTSGTKYSKILSKFLFIFFHHRVEYPRIKQCANFFSKSDQPNL